MSLARDQLRGVGYANLGLAVAAVVAIVGIVAVFTTAIDLGGIVGSMNRVAIAVVGLGLGGVVAKQWIDAEPGGYEPPEGERVAPAAVPGTDLDELLALGQAAGSREAVQFYRSQVRDELLDVGTAVLVRHRGLDPEEARNRLRAGDWTDDEVAANCFMLNADVAGELTDTLRRPVGGESAQVRQARRALAELERIAEVDD